MPNHAPSAPSARETPLDERFQQLTDYIHHVFWICAADFSEMVYVSPAYEAIWGLTCDSLYRSPLSWIDAIHPDDRAEAVAAIGRGRERSFEVEYRIVRADGSVRWIRDRGFPIRNSDGNVYRLAGLAEDFTEQKHTDEQLRRSEHLLAEAQRLAHIGSWNLDVPTRTVTWSDELYRIFGLEPGEIDPGRQAMDFIHPADRAELDLVLKVAFEGRDPFSLTYRIRRRDGSERFLQSQGYVVCDDHGTPLNFFGTTQDMTERLHAEEALGRSEELLRLVLEAIPVGVAVMDVEGNIVLANSASSTIWDGSLPPAPDRYVRSAGWWHDTGARLEPSDWASVRAREKGETSLNELIDIESFKGARKTIQNSAIPVRSEAGAIIGAVVINEDATARIAAEGHLKKSAKQMQVLARRLMHAQDDERRRIARILHETTAQDLAALKMLLSHLSRTLREIPDTGRRLIEESVELVDRSITGARTLSALLHPPLLDERGLISAIRWYAEGFAARSGIAVSFALPETFERLPQDVETALFRVVQEALINIHRHAESETAHVSITIDGGQLILTIADYGRGIPADVVSRLMGAAGELGVGIVGMRERLKQLGGRLEIESDSDGTVLRAVMPLTDEAE
jgi:PAS domain S-box-containing protein